MFKVVRDPVTGGYVFQVPAIEMEQLSKSVADNADKLQSSIDRVQDLDVQAPLKVAQNQLKCFLGIGD